MIGKHLYMLGFIAKIVCVDDAVIDQSCNRYTYLLGQIHLHMCLLFLQFCLCHTVFAELKDGYENVIKIDYRQLQLILVSSEFIWGFITTLATTATTLIWKNIRVQ